MAKKPIYHVIHKQYGNELEAFNHIYTFTSRLKAAQLIVKLYNKADRSENYISPVHYSKWGRYTTYNPLTIDSFHVSCRHCNEQSVKLVCSSVGKPVNF